MHVLGSRWVDLKSSPILNAEGAKRQRRWWASNFLRDRGIHHSYSSGAEYRERKRIHIAGVFDDEAARLYVDGRLQEAKQIHPWDAPIFRPRSSVEETEVTIGGRGVRCFGGLIDEVRISKSLRYTTSAFVPPRQFGTDKQTVALYRFDEGTGDVLKDSSKNGHDGRIIGATWVRIDAAAHPEPQEQTGEPGDKPTGTPLAAVVPFDAGQAKEHQRAWARHLDVPVEYENSVGMKFVLIPPGEFLMGCTPEEIDGMRPDVLRNQWEETFQDFLTSTGPQHRVVLTQPFYLGVHEVTQKQYQTVMGKNPSHYASTGSQEDRAAKVAGLDTANFPVDGVSWNDAAEFCAKLSERESLKPFYFRADSVVTLLEGVTGYRLPTSAEWEFAARAGATTPYWSGSTEDALQQIAWTKPNSGDRTHAVGQLPANPFGLHDMHGNVNEWCHDRWGQSYYAEFTEPAVDPMGPASGELRILRGGSIGDPMYLSHVGNFYAHLPIIHLPWYGFRVALPISAVPIESAGLRTGQTDH